MPSKLPDSPDHDPETRLLAVPRLVGDLVVALSYSVRELPFLVEDLRGLVRQLERAAHPGGELMRLLDGVGRLAYARAERERERVTD